jgi:hypothetical protein
MRDCRPRLFAATALASLFFAPTLAAQAGLGHVEDASVTPKGLLRLRAISTWTRYDQRFTATGVESLGARFTTDSLGVRAVPALSAIESRVQSASGAPFVLTLGRSRLDATGREEIVPLGLEYGVTNRFSVGVTVPIVRKRVAVLFRLDTTGSKANVGPNPNRTSTAASLNNNVVQTEFTSAAAQLQSRLTFCQANPGSSGCPALLARQAEAQLLIQSSQSFATDLAALYGSSASTGMAFVPIGGSAAHAAIALRVADFNTRYRDLLASSTSLIQAVPRAAGGPAGPANFQQYFTKDLRRDSLTTSERLGIGDVEVGFKLLVLDRRRSATRRVGAQLAIASAVRLPTGSRQSPSELTDLQLGSGHPIVDTRLFLDLRAGRLGLLTAGQFASVAASGDSTTPKPNGRWGDVQVAPRWHLSEALAVHAAYSMRYTESTGDQLLGGGVSYSNLSTYKGSGPSPIEMRFTHLEAVKGGAGRPKIFRDQLELRIYYRLR